MREEAGTATSESGKRSRENRYERKSVIVTSQLSFDKWYDYIGQTTVADTILDRIIHSSHLIRLEGESLRKRNRKL